MLVVCNWISQAPFHMHIYNISISILSLLMFYTWAENTRVRPHSSPTPGRAKLLLESSLSLLTIVLCFLPEKLSNAYCMRGLIRIDRYFILSTTIWELGGWSMNECQSESKRKQVARGKRRKQKVHMTTSLLSHQKHTYLYGNWRKKRWEKSHRSPFAKVHWNKVASLTRLT